MVMSERVRQYYEENPGVHPELREMIKALNRIAFTFQYGTAINFETDWGGSGYKQSSVGWDDAHGAADFTQTTPPVVGNGLFSYVRNWIAEATEYWRIDRAAFEFDLSAYDPDTQRIVAARLTLQVTNEVGTPKLCVSEADSTFDADMWVGNLNNLLLGVSAAAVDGAGPHSIPFNDDGVEFLNNGLGGSVYLAVRDYVNDYLDVEIVDDTQYVQGNFNTGTLPKIEFDVGYKG